VEGVRAGLGDAATVRFDVITNGVFLTPELVASWVPLGLHGAKVTLDGDETTHSKTRRSKKRGEDSFATIFANVVAASRSIDIYLNGNYTAENLPGFVPLLEKLVAAGFKKGSRVHFSPALQALGAPPESGAGGCSYATASHQFLIPLADAVRRAGFEPVDDSVVGPCAFNRRHSYSIDPAGEIYKCPAFLGKPEWSVGHVEAGLDPRYDRMVSFNPQSSCGSCAHRPDCGGGCVAAKWIAAGRMEGVGCELQFFDRYKAEFIKRKFVLATSDSVEEALSRLPDTRVALPQEGDTFRTADGQIALRVLAA
jgi:uncharacterized protein